MKRTLGLLMLSLLLAGCSDVGGGSTTAPPAESAGPDNGDTVKVAFVSQVEGIPYFSGFEQGATAEAESLGITYEQAGPATADSAEQLRIFNSLVQQGFQAIAISPLDPSSMNSAIADARAKGVIVITSDADAPDSQRQLFVQQATDDGLGATVMDQIAQAAGESGEYGIVSGAPDTDTFTRWIAAIEKQQQNYPDMELVGGIRYTTTTEQALTEAQNLMTANPELAGIIAIPSTAVPGVAQAVKNAGKSGEVAVTGFGSPQTAAPFLKDGSMTSTVLWNVPELGALTVWAMNELVAGREPAASNTIDGFDQPITYDPESQVLLLGDPMVFTADNVDDFDY
ncbi:MAG: autoinducer 2 ABC transporter substrate-binding protein [Arachnia sp.]